MLYSRSYELFILNVVVCICQTQSPNSLASVPNMDFPGDSVVRDPPAIQETWVRSRLGRSPGRGHGNPLQYACLENPRDRGTWWVTVYRAAKSQTQLKWLNRHAGMHTPRHARFSPQITIHWFFTSVTKHSSVYGKMLETGLIEIIPWICTCSVPSWVPSGYTVGSG